MHDLVVLLAQMNTSTSGQSGGQGTAPAVERTGATAVGTGGTGVTPATAEAGAGGAAAAGPATTVAAGGAPPTTQPAAQSSPFTMILPIVLMFAVLYFVLFRGQKKDEKKRKAMIAELKKGDRVMTIGGMMARVVSIDGEEVVLKVDESANVKATYRKSAIQEVIDQDENK